MDILLLSDHITSRMPSGLIVVDRNGNIVAHNPASERIFEGRLGRSSRFCDLVRESQALQDLVDRCLNSGEVFTRIEFNAPIRTDVDKRIGINLSPITSETGSIEGAICLLSDLTEIVELHNRIKLKENFAALGEMSAGIAHEFKNSLATIVGYAQMSTAETDVATVQGYAREIHKESLALSHMVTDFLNFARPVMASIDEVDLAELLSNTIADMKNLRPGNYEVRFNSSGKVVVPCDPTLMRQSFLNLLINAAEALDRNGVIQVSVDALKGRRRPDRHSGQRPWHAGRRRRKSLHSILYDKTSWHRPRPRPRAKDRSRSQRPDRTAQCAWQRNQVHRDIAR